MQTEPFLELEPQSVGKFAGLAKDKSKSLQPLPAAVGVGGLVLGSSVPHVVV